MRRDRIISLLARAALLGLVTLTGACTVVSLRTPTPSLGPQPASPLTGGPMASATGAVAPSAVPASAMPGSSASTSATPPSTGITEAQAIAAVQAFAPHATGLHVTESDTVPAGRSFRVQSEEIIAEVDEATGQVRMFLDNGAMPTVPGVKVSRDQALAAATTWLASHAISTAGLSPTTTLLDHGSIQEYAVDFTGRVNGARVPNRVNISINPLTGAVYAFVLFTRPFAPPPAPRLTVAEAVSAARAEEQDAGAKVTSTDLAIAFDAAGTQLLVYEVDLTRTDGYYAKLQVDALSGAVTVLGRG
ncbi:MAG TPA: PepSY domain-containing protein [Candidatus Limnocylindrales bacterium]